MTRSKKYFRIAVRKFRPFETAIEKCWRSYCSFSGCDLILEAVPMDLPELHKSVIEEEGLKNGSWDLAHMSSDWIAEAQCSNSIESLSPFIEAEKDSRFLTDWTPSLLRSQTINDQLFGLPFHDGPECLIYRKDLFDDPVNQARFRQQYQLPLVPPTDWPSFQKIAAFFSDPTNKFYGTAIAAYPDGHNAVYDFCIHVWTRGGSFTANNGSVNIQCPEVIEALSFYRSLFHQKNTIHPSSPDFDSVKAGESFAQGEIAMVINWFGFAAFAQLDGGSKVKDRIGVAPIPHSPGHPSVSPNSYWMYSIGRGSTRKALAFDFIRYATSPQNDRKLTLEGGIGCRKSTWKDAAINEKIPFFHQLEELHQYARELPSLKQWPSLAAVIDRIMTKVLLTTEPIEKILAGEQHFIHQNITNDAY